MLIACCIYVYVYNVIECNLFALAGKGSTWMQLVPASGPSWKASWNSFQVRTARHPTPPLLLLSLLFFLFATSPAS